MSEPRNISARMAHWSAHHRKIAIFGWLAFCLGAFVIGTMVIGTNTLKVADAGVRESGAWTAWSTRSSRRRQASG